MWTNTWSQNLTFTSLINWTIPFFIGGNTISGTYFPVPYGIGGFDSVLGQGNVPSLTVNWQNFSNASMTFSFTANIRGGTQPDGAEWFFSFQYPPNQGLKVFTPTLSNSGTTLITLIAPPVAFFQSPGPWQLQAIPLAFGGGITIIVNNLSGRSIDWPSFTTGYPTMTFLFYINGEFM